MGMFDTVLYSCPHCDEQIEDQSKAGQCNLDTFTLDNAPPSVLLSISNWTLDCPSCHQKFHIKTEITKSYQIVKGEYNYDENN